MIILPIGTNVPKPAKVRVANASKQYGNADPKFTALPFTGFVGADTQAAIAGAPAFYRDPGENVGTYAIHGSLGTLSAWSARP